MTNQGSKSVSGIEIKVGDSLHMAWNDWAEVTAIEFCSHPLGAKYANVTLADGRKRQCWAGFNYQILVAIHA